MSEAKFTPEPWNLVVEKTRDENIHIDICNNSGHFIGLVVNNVNIGVEEALANANLIAASPELYEFIDCVMRITDDVSLYKEADRLLRKARGER